MTIHAGTDWIREFAATSRLSDVQVRELADTAGFGETFTDHMVTARWSADDGWHDPRVLPRRPMTVDPAMVGLHYGQVVFEGLKVYRTPEGGAAGFRLAEHCRRLARSASRFAIPEFPEDLFLESITELVRADSRWLPSICGRALYLRPTLLGTETTLALRPSATYSYLLLAFPTGSFFGSVAESVSVWATHRYSRAAPGGTGAAKCAGNYAASFLAQQEARERGCHQVLWLDAVERQWIEEMGGMNVFWVCADGSLVTPPLTGTVLEGVTRDSIMVLARRRGISVREKRVGLADFLADVTAGRITEAFACGTAAAITPIRKVASDIGSCDLGGGLAGPITHLLRSDLTAIHHGTSGRPERWMTTLL
ncbi:branched-chain amino acid aminotransferase [Lentzea jiangxiensis]|uniref:Branched-chain-amino-acid aminotransferase n=1 Tax=Lentzea jiangxiensis TaxID=641025 RepID=A0A1H0WTZ7_9PSEU|nr:branched-chain amino acid aminotransferase [Lentzea jiangxiensis]SDP94224.1 branched-chain amino acid aminotransferase [Lentzea jiangxiensis]